MREKYNKQIPEDALRIIERLEQAGYEAYIVGGCVRDMIMGREPNDWDITTSAEPEAVKEIFERTYDTGIEHGTVTVILHKEHFEVTTYRIEGEYKDFRRPENVNFVEDITEDLSRRDFTMNAIAYHPERGFVDPYNGVKDIKAGIICSVRNAKERFEEDALRILRAIRFSAVLGFAIEADTKQGIKACKELLQHISKERIRDEFLKICMSDRPMHIKMLYDMDILKYILPEFIPFFKIKQKYNPTGDDIAIHTIKAIEIAPKDVIVRLALLFHHFYDNPKDGLQITKEALKELRFDNHTIRDVCALVKCHTYHLEKKISRVTIKEILREIDSELFDKLLIVQSSDSRAEDSGELLQKLEAIERAGVIKASVIENKECYKLSMLAITGADLIAQGIPKGKIIGEVLEKTLAYIIESPGKNNKDELLEYAEAVVNV